MAEKPVFVEVSMGGGSDQVMFTEVFDDGYRVAYWLPFWKAVWHAWKLIWRGVKVVDEL